MTLYKNELRKLREIKYLLIFPLITIVIQCFVAFSIKYHPSLFPDKENLLINGFAGGTLIAIYMIIASSDLINNEFKNKTCNVLFSHGFSRTEIYSNKIAALVTYNLFLLIFTYLFSIVISKGLNLKINLSHKLVTNIVKFAFTSMLSLWLIVLAVILISIIFENSSIATMIGTVFYFAPGMIGGVLSNLDSKFSWVKYNLLNMSYYPSQVIHHAIHTLTHLSTFGLLLGNISYLVIFLVLIFIFQYKDM